MRYEESLVAYLSYAQTLGWNVWRLPKRKRKDNKNKFRPEYNLSNMTHLEVSDFYEIPEGIDNMNDTRII